MCHRAVWLIRVCLRVCVSGVCVRAPRVGVRDPASVPCSLPPCVTSSHRERKEKHKTGARLGSVVSTMIVSPRWGAPGRFTPRTGSPGQRAVHDWGRATRVCARVSGPSAP